MGKSVNETYRIMKESVLDARKYFNNNNLLVNLLKTICKLIWSSINRNKIAYADNIQDVPLSQVRNFPYLEVQAYQNLKWVVHVLNLCKKATLKL